MKQKSAGAKARDTPSADPDGLLDTLSDEWRALVKVTKQEISKQFQTEIAALKSDLILKDAHRKT